MSLSAAMLDAIDRNLDLDIDAHRESLIRFCGQLVAEESVNPPGQTVGVADAVQRYLTEHGLGAERVAMDEAAPNVVCTLEAPRAGAHVVFNAHMDTMLPGDESAWSVPILEMTRRDGRLYGLGMGNMKGGLAAMALAMVAVRNQLSQLSGKLSLTAVSDEVMFGDRGTPFLLSRRPDLYGDFMICAEGPGSMGFAVAEKGLLWADVTAKGSIGHSSRAMREETAVARLSAFLREVDMLNDHYATVPPELDGLDGGEGNLGFRLSVNVGVIEAGDVRSLIAPQARAKLDIRLPPGISMADVKAMLSELIARHEGISIDYAKGWDASWAPFDSALVRTLSDAAAQVRQQPTAYVVRLPGSDARYWRDRGILSACYGPQPTLSSDVDDYAGEQDVVDCAKIFARTAVRLMAGQ